MDIRQKLKDMPAWKKYGINISISYFIAVILAVFGSMLGIAGSGEGDVLGWFLIALVFPAASLLSTMGLQVMTSISLSLVMLLIVNPIVVCAIGSLIGYIVGLLKK